MRGTPDEPPTRYRYPMSDVGIGQMTTVDTRDSAFSYFENHPNGCLGLSETVDSVCLLSLFGL